MSEKSRKIEHHRASQHQPCLSRTVHAYYVVAHDTRVASSSRQRALWCTGRADIAFRLTTLLVEPRVGRSSPSGDGFCSNEPVAYRRNFIVVQVGELTDGTVGPTGRLT